MNKNLKKNQILQFFILWYFYFINNEINEEIDIENSNIIKKDSELYNFYKKIVSYNHIIKKYMKHIKKNYQIPSDKNNILLDNNEYFYIYYNKHNILVYFFKDKTSNSHNIFFNGLNNKKDIDGLLNIILRVLSNKFDFEHVENIIEKNGMLFEFEKNDVTKINFINEDNITDNKLMVTFDYIYKNHYEKDDVINLNINGYSLGGIFSQVFVHLLSEKYNIENNKKLNINLNNIESWFVGDEDNFKKFIQKTNYKHIFNKKSIFYYYNIYFQSFVDNIHYIDEKKEDNDIEEFIENNLFLFPFGIVNYINKNHFLSKIFD